LLLASGSEVCQHDLATLFTVNQSKIKEDVIDNPASLDGIALVARIDEALSTDNLEDLRGLWSYIKSRQRHLRQDLSEDEQRTLDRFIEAKVSGNIFILSKGDLETYLPEGYRSKDLDKLIRFLRDQNFWDNLPPFAQTELKSITQKIFAL